MTTPTHRVAAFLDRHWALKWFGVPILFMTTAVLLLVWMTGNALSAVQVAGIFAALSVGVVVVSLLLERVVQGVTGGRLLGD
jgi:hypothetical protein